MRAFLFLTVLICLSQFLLAVEALAEVSENNSDSDLSQIISEREKVLKALSEKLNHKNKAFLDKISEKNMENIADISSKKTQKISPKIPDFKKSDTTIDDVKAKKNTNQMPLKSDLKSQMRDVKNIHNPESKVENSADKPAKNIESFGDDYDSYFEQKIKAKLLEDIKKTKEKGLLESDLPKIHNFYQSTVKSGNLKVYSTNYDARNLGTAVTENIDEVVSSIFGLKAQLLHPVEIHMLLESEAKFDGNFLEIVERNSIRLSVKTNEKLNLEEFCRRVISLYLRSYAFVSGGEQAYKNVPYWLELSIAARLSQKISNGITFEMARFASENPPDILDEVFKYAPEKNVDRFKESSAYWNLLALKVAYKSDFENLMLDILKSPNSRGEILESIKQKNGGKNFEIHWRAYILGEVYGRLGGIKNLKDSESEILRLSILLRQRQGEPFEPVFDSKIFDLANFTKAEIESRLLEIKLALPWINPAYYNTLVSLGRMYQAAFDSDKELFNSEREDFLNELKKSRNVSDKVGELLKE